MSVETRSTPTACTWKVRRSPSYAMAASGAPVTTCDITHPLTGASI